MIALNWKRLDLATSTCQRTLYGNSITEIVNLDGSDEDISREEMETFIASPVVPSGRV